MIAYRIELWCSEIGCAARRTDGTIHDDPAMLPRFTEILLDLRKEEGWLMEHGEHFCPKHAEKRKAK